MCRGVPGVSRGRPGCSGRGVQGGEDPNSVQHTTKSADYRVQIAGKPAGFQISIIGVFALECG